MRAGSLGIAAAILALIPLLVGCGRREDATEPCLTQIPLGLGALMPVPEGNRITTARVALGRRLFFEPGLSRDRTLSCASCHRPERAFSDGRVRAIGIDAQPGRRNVPSLVNCAYRDAMFWDGRADTLEQQALQPIENPGEMGHSTAIVVQQLRDDPSYRAAFESAFGSSGVDAERLAQAIASFERSIVAADTPFDRHALLGDHTALSEAARRGFELFEGKARCAFCHEGRLFSDGQFHNTGVGWGEEPVDLGRFEATGRAEDRGRFRTPSLRELVHTAPFMHDGRIPTLADVVDFYDRGAGANLYLDAKIQPLGLTGSEKADLVEFLESISTKPALLKQP